MIRQIIMILKTNYLLIYSIKSYNCSSIARVLKEQQNPLSVGLSLNRSEHSYCLPYQLHSRNIPTPSSVTPLQVCITYNMPNNEKNLLINIEIIQFYLSQNNRQLLLIIIQNNLGTIGQFFKPLWIILSSY